MLGIPVLAAGTLAAYAIAGERQQGTLEPVLTTPIRPEELLVGKLLAVLAPSIVIAYAVFAAFLVLVALFANPAVSSALLQGPDIVAQVVFTPLLAAWASWVGIAISTRSSDVRVAQQLSLLGNLPLVLVTSLIAFNAIEPTRGAGDRARSGPARRRPRRLADRDAAGRSRAARQRGLRRRPGEARASAPAGADERPPARCRLSPPSTPGGDTRSCSSGSRSSRTTRSSARSP